MPFHERFIRKSWCQLNSYSKFKIKKVLSYSSSHQKHLSQHRQTTPGTTGYYYRYTFIITNRVVDIKASNLGFQISVNLRLSPFRITTQMLIIRRIGRWSSFSVFMMAQYPSDSRESRPSALQAPLALLSNALMNAMEKRKSVAWI